MAIKGKLVFDMDGTIADLYGVEGWLEMLRAEDVTPYAIAQPLYDMQELVGLLLELQAVGYLIAVTTWLSMGASVEYKRETRIVKKEWLDAFGFPYDEFHAVQYGTPKHYVTKGENQILFDDSLEVRSCWSKGETVDANENIIPFLQALLEQAQAEM